MHGSLPDQQERGEGWPGSWGELGCITSRRRAGPGSHRGPQAGVGACEWGAGLAVTAPVTWPGSSQNPHRDPRRSWCEAHRTGRGWRLRPRSRGWQVTQRGLEAKSDWSLGSAWSVPRLQVHQRSLAPLCQTRACRYEEGSGKAGGDQLGKALKARQVTADRGEPVKVPEQRALTMRDQKHPQGRYRRRAEQALESEGLPDGRPSREISHGSTGTDSSLTH